MIYVFKTSVNTQLQVEELKPHINAMLPEVKWNFDLQDCDRILRVDTNENVACGITDLLRVHQFQCDELE